VFRYKGLLIAIQCQTAGSHPIPGRK